MDKNTVWSMLYCENKTTGKNTDLEQRKIIK